MKFHKRDFTKSLYEAKNLTLKSISTIAQSLKERKRWIATGITIYGLPAFYRAVTRSDLPLPLFETSNEYIPKNLIEKLLVNPIAPGGVGAVIGETFIEKFTNRKNKGLRKYLSRVFGSIVTTGIWTGIQYLGYTVCDMLKYEWPSGGNPFESPNVYPFNILIAISLAPLVPYAADLLKLKTKRNRERNES